MGDAARGDFAVMLGDERGGGEGEEQGGAETASAAPAAPASPANNDSSLLLSSILGSPAGTAKTANLSDLFDNAPLVERSVDDEMDALFGAPPRKG